jgi:hypothetical protein
MYITLRNLNLISKKNYSILHLYENYFTVINFIYFCKSFTLFAIILLYLKNDFIFIMSKNIILATIYKLVFKHNTNIAYVGQSTNINSRF